MRIALVCGLLLASVLAASALDWAATGKTYDDILDMKKGEEFLRDAAKSLQQVLGDRDLSVVTAESLTAGKIFSTLVDVARFGGNKYGSFGVYDSDAKRRFLGVQVPNVYSESCSRQMARGALLRSRALVGIAVTGHAALMQKDHMTLGNVDLAISIRTSKTHKSTVQSTLTGLYGGFPVENDQTKKDNLGWGIATYTDDMRALDSGDFATFHVHLAICEKDHGFPGTKAKCDELKTSMSGTTDYALAQDLRDVVRRSVVYAAIKLTEEVILKAHATKSAFPNLVLPPATPDTTKARQNCEEPSFVINNHLATKITHDTTAKCNTHTHIAPTDFATDGNPAFYEEDGMLRGNEF